MSSFGNRFVRYLRRLGAGSLLVSLVLHAVLIVIATAYVVSSVMEKREAKFQGGAEGAGTAASSVQHRVQMSRLQPTLSTLNQRLSVDSPGAAVSLPDLPDVPGLAGGGPKMPGGGESGLGGQGVGAGTGRGPVMPSFGFRDAQPGGALVGHFYDLKQIVDLGRAVDNPELSKLEPGPLAEKILKSFTQGTWNRAGFSKYYRAPSPLYATQVFVPNVPAEEAPKAYGVEKQVKARAWLVHYRGRVSPPSHGAYRFVGGADDFLVVRINGRIVLDGGLFKTSSFQSDLPPGEQAYPYEFPAPGNFLQKTQRQGFVVGNRMDLQAGVFYDIDILVGEGLGGHFYAFLYFQKEGETYATDAGGRSVLPVFRVANTPPPENGSVMPPLLADGPVWRCMAPSL